jgi:lipopolysaccharide export system permease protein
LKKLDWYIIFKFLGTFLYTILLFTAIAIVIDITEKIDDFLENDLSFIFIVGNYYLHFVPWIVLMLSSLFVLISVVFFTSRLANNSEIIAMLSGGVSFNRLLVPYILTSMLLTGVFLYFNHQVVPASNLARFEFEDQYVRPVDKSRDRNFHLQIAPDTLMYLQNYTEQTQTGNKFTLEYFKERDLKYKLSADQIKWMGDSIGWELVNIVERKDIGWKEEITEIKQDKRQLGFLPEILEEKVMLKETMTTPVLIDYIQEEKKRGGVNLDFFYVELYRRSTVPASTLILTIIGVSLTTRRARGGMGIHIVAGIVLGALYIAMLQFSVTFATKGNLDPLLASWLPNIVFAMISIWLLIRAPK